jgi:carbon-monoxide dehydrogenase medium subunit
MKLPSFDYARPETVDEAVEMLVTSDGSGKILAGGQTLVPLMAFRLAAPSVLIDIGRIAELRHISTENGLVTLGATVRWAEILRHQELARIHPMLPAAIAHVAHYQIRNRGTVGGSLAHADNASEMLGICVACDAEIVIRGPNELRSVKAKEFVLGPLETVLSDQEIIVKVCFPLWSAGRRWEFAEFARRSGDFALAAVALHYHRDEAGRCSDVHLAVLGACSRPTRVPAAEAILEGHQADYSVISRIAAEAAEVVDLEDDNHSSQAYRRALVSTLVERGLQAAEARQA